MRNPACVVGIAGAAWLGRLVARAGLTPVDQLTESVERVAGTMDLSRPIEVTGADEVARLVDLDAQVRELTSLATELVEPAREDTTREAAEPVDLAEVVTAAVTRFRTRAAAVTFTTDLGPAVVSGRPGELERMVVNVLDNAAKWSPAGATVHAALRADGPHWCELTVTDEGPGIVAEDLPHIFDCFYRTPSARAMPGSGLGLAIVAQTATHHGGTATAARRAPNGTLVTIRLPLSP